MPSSKMSAKDLTELANDKAAEVERLRTVLETIAGTKEGQRLFGGLIRTALAEEKA